MHIEPEIFFEEDGFKSETNGIVVSAYPLLVEELSDIEACDLCWVYHMQIENHSQSSITLLERRYEIIDSNGKKQHINNIGINSELAFIDVGETLEYTSGTPLKNASAIVKGSYVMEDDKGNKFEVNIPVFSLDVPNQSRLLN